MTWLKSLLPWKPKPAEPEQLGFIGLAVPAAIGAFSLVKILLIGATAISLSYVAGRWVGESAGYDKRNREIAVATAAKNAEIDQLNSESEAAQLILDSQRRAAIAAAAKSVADLPKSLRDQCAQQCSMPASTRAKLESLE